VLTKVVTTMVQRMAAFGTWLYIACASSGGDAVVNCAAPTRSNLSKAYR
jgi:hypothetical protein